MTNKERLEKLEQAYKLLREVEFSYPVGHTARKMMYCVMVQSFSLTHIGQLISELKASLRCNEHKWIDYPGNNLVDKQTYCRHCHVDKE